MTDTDKDPQGNIEKCFEEIKQVLKKHDCEIFFYDAMASIYHKESDEMMDYIEEDFTK